MLFHHPNVIIARPIISIRKQSQNISPANMKLSSKLQINLFMHKIFSEQSKYFRQHWKDKIFIHSTDVCELSIINEMYYRNLKYTYRKKNSISVEPSIKGIEMYEEHNTKSVNLNSWNSGQVVCVLDGRKH